MTKTEYYNSRKDFAPTAGMFYENEGGGTYMCVRSLGGCDAVMINAKSGWCLQAHNVGIYSDGKIDWTHSSEGYFVEGGSE